jgi:dTDP-4-amino-4,6-dideoxygalactose transaminase
MGITINGATPVFVEPDEYDNIDADKIEAAITEKTKAILAVHLYGQACDMTKIMDIAKRHNLRVVEDCAQSHGNKWQGQVVGSFGDIGCFSFYPTKGCGAFGDAGAVTTDDEELADIIRALGNYGSARHYVFDYVGRNSRIDELQAAILDAKLKCLDETNAKRKEIASLYINNVYHPLIVIPQSDRDSVWHIFPILSERRDELKQYLLEHGVETEIHYPIPPHQQACYSDWNNRSYPITERIHAEELSLPCNPAMTNEEANIVADLLNSFV